jgi:asparaginyl-tRNA synthetase
MVLGAVSRIRNALAFATHEFFQGEGFQYVHTPLITCADCEGAGEMFQVTTLIKDSEFTAKTPQGKPDYSRDFFKKPAFLTVSGQLNAEIYATALSSVYTFGPTFRAEPSMTRRHLSEFWMIEPEIAFADLQENMCVAESFLKYVMDAALKRNGPDMQVLEKFETASHVDIPEEEKKAVARSGQPHWRSLPLRKRLQNIIDAKFARVTYTEAIEILIKAVAAGHEFEVPVEWGMDMGSEHERYLCEVHFRAPTIVINYPKAIKAFYMRENDDKKTVAAMDVLVPGVGELIGGSQREERHDHLEARMVEAKLDPEDYRWYLDLRKFGTVPHSGFGAGFERLVCYTTGIDHIRDAIPFPRYPGHADF